MEGLGSCIRECQLDDKITVPWTRTGDGRWLSMWKDCLAILDIGSCLALDDSSTWPTHDGDVSIWNQ